MVSKASDDLPEPDNPVITVSELRGISRLIFFRLCWRAPRMTSVVRPMVYRSPSTGAPAHSKYTEARITFYNNRQRSQWSIFRDSRSWVSLQCACDGCCSLRYAANMPEKRAPDVTGGF